MRGVILLEIESAPLSEDEDENENDISDMKNICKVRWELYCPLNYKFTQEFSSEIF